MCTGSALLSCPFPSSWLSLGLFSAAELQLCSQVGLDTQPSFFSDLRAKVIFLKCLWTAGSYQYLLECS